MVSVNQRLPESGGDEAPGDESGSANRIAHIEVTAVQNAMTSKRLHADPRGAM